MTLVATIMYNWVCATYRFNVNGIAMLVYCCAVVRYAATLSGLHDAVHALTSEVTENTTYHDLT